MFSSVAMADQQEVSSISSAKRNILIVDDDESLREFLEIFLANEGYKVRSAPSGEAALEEIRQRAPDLVISDIRMPGMDGVQLLKEIKGIDPTVPVVLITAFASLDSAVEAMKEGAWDYVTKPFQLEELREIVERAISSASTKAARPVDEDNRIFQCDQMVAKSPSMLKIFQLIARIASSTSSVLITGESGTGKELVARAIHNLGARKDGPFVAVNCGGIPENLLESELFGHVKGAFTGADRDKEGLFVLASGGTLFLDEIGELPLSLQVKLLRAVQQKAVTPVGGTRPISTDCRIIAATNRNLEEEVMNGNFREDLYYRLNVLQIRVPPLRERPEDIPLLVQYFLDKYSREQGREVQGISRFAMDALLKYAFPGNVRELENIIERSVALSASSLILPESLSLARFKERQDGGSKEGVQGGGQVQTALSPESVRIRLPEEGLDLDELLGSIEKDLLQQALSRTGGKKMEAAKLLGLNFRSFRYRVAKYEIS